jgi:hypothetical protein
MDEHVHKAVTNSLRIRGVDVLTVQEDGLAGKTDLMIMDRATALKRLIFSQDQDFLIEANRRQVEGIEFAGVVYGHQSEVSIGDCIYGLELIAKLGTPEEFVNRVEYLPF